MVRISIKRSERVTPVIYEGPIPSKFLKVPSGFPGPNFYGIYRIDQKTDLDKICDELPLFKEGLKSAVLERIGQGDNTISKIIGHYIWPNYSGFNAADFVSGLITSLEEDKRCEISREGIIRRKLESKLRIGNGDLCWRLDLLKNLTLIEVEKKRNGDIVRITELGKNLMKARGKEFEIIIEALRDESDVDNGLALRAVGGDKTQAGKLLHWLNGDKGRKHAPGVRDLYRVHGDARRLSKAFFSRREAGSRQEQHIGIKIEDHNAAGKLLVRVLTG